MSFATVYWLCICFIPGGSLPLHAQTAQDNSTTTFIVVRHAERDGNQDKLTDAGKQRSELLASLGDALNVKAIYSTSTERTRGTAQPLADKVGAEITTYGRLTKDWIASLQKKHPGQAVLIVGHSNTAGVIAGLLGNEKPYKIEHDEYDALFIIQVSSSETRSMRLRYGLTSKGAPSADPDKMGKTEAIK